MFAINNIPPYDLAVAATVTATVLTIIVFAKTCLARRLDRLTAENRLQTLNYPQQLLRATRLPFIVAVALLAGISQFDFTSRQEKWLGYAWTLILVTQIAMWGERIISVAVQRAFEHQRTSNPSAATHLMLGGLIGRIVLWSIAILIILDNFGFNISTLMASLGIGGIAVALAAQNILGDLFSSVSIALDKPFVLGDFIIVGDYMGTVEYVGMKSTRLRSLGGEQIIFSNSELLRNRIRNYKRMQERRILFEFSIAYETPIAKVEATAARIREIISSDRLAVRFDRAHLKSLGDSGLVFEVVYYMLDPDYNKYMDVQQTINLALLRDLGERGVALAYPTQTLHIASSKLVPAHVARLLQPTSPIPTGQLL